MNTFSVLFIITLGLVTGTQLWLAKRQYKRVYDHRNEVPAAFSDKIPLDAHQKAADYTLGKIRFENANIIFSAFIILCWTFGGGLELLDNTWRNLGLSSVATGIGVMLSVFYISNIIDLPFSVYRTFVLEQRFGFNHTTIATFIKDLLISEHVI